MPNTPCNCAMKCPYNTCMSGNVPNVTATCQSPNTWSFSVPGPCAIGGTPCPSSPCPAGEVCLTTNTGVSMKQTCQPDPCKGAPLSCGCAKPIFCQGDAYTCMTNGTDEVTCTCLACQ
jgi:hypothetical protein